MEYFKQLFEELKRRNIYKVAVTYGITGWVIVQMASIATNTFEAPDWVMKMVITVIILGFPVAVILAWAFEITPNGIKWTQEVVKTDSITSKNESRLNYWIISLLSAALLFFIIENFWFEKAFSNSIQPVSEAGVPSVAVLPFKDFSKEGNQKWFADGLTEEILNSLARMQGLKVVARTSSFHFKNTNLPIPQIADTLGVDHIVEGSVRRAGDDMRITAQLIRAENSFHLWSKTYKRKVDDVFEVQEDISENIASALNIYLDDQKRKKMFAFGTRNVDAYEAYLKGRNIYEELHLKTELTDQLFDLAVPWFRKAIQLDPHFGAPYYYLSDPYIHYILNYPKSKIDTLGLAEAKKRMLFNLEQAIMFTKDPSLRLMYRFECTFLSDNWNLIPELVQQLKKSSEFRRAFAMLGGGWTKSFLKVTGHAKLQYQLSTKALQLDPLDPGLAASQIQALMNFASADSVLQAINNYPLAEKYPTYTKRFQFFTYLRTGQIDKADSVAQSTLSPAKTVYTLLVQAVRGNRDKALLHFKKLPDEFKNSIRSLSLHYVLGNIEKVNRLAARVDATPFGPIKLLMSAAVTSVGILPFQLTATPNLAARLQEAEVKIAPFKIGSVTLPRVVQKEL